MQTTYIIYIDSIPIIARVSSCQSKVPKHILYIYTHIYKKITTQSPNT